MVLWRGGDSLLAMEMLLQLEQLIGKAVPETILFGAETIRQLAWQRRPRAMPEDIAPSPSNKHPTEPAKSCPWRSIPVRSSNAWRLAPAAPDVQIFCVERSDASGHPNDRQADEADRSNNSRSCRL
ncbi:acyl carrier protein [Bradyrhizobium brasilense]|uniref:acyl carrier protein n=1 Tax=Bradyrhizobium brasilense TaxID=1419277 RepID=UPI003CC561F4